MRFCTPQPCQETSEPKLASKGEASELKLASRGEESEQQRGFLWLFVFSYTLSFRLLCTLSTTSFALRFIFQSVALLPLSDFVSLYPLCYCVYFSYSQTFLTHHFYFDLHLLLPLLPSPSTSHCPYIFTLPLSLLMTHRDHFRLSTIPQARHLSSPLEPPSSPSSQQVDISLYTRHRVSGCIC